MSVNYKAMRVRMSESQAQACTADLQTQTRPVVGFHVIGYCPRCTDRTHDLFPVEYLAGQDSAALTSARAAAVKALRLGTVTVRPDTVMDAGTTLTGAGPTEATVVTEVALQRCRCIENHAGADGSYGCGATWLIAATFDPSDTTHPVTFAAVSAEDAFKEWEGAASRAQSAATALATVQAAATKWQTALTAILGLIAVLAVIGGRSTLQGLTTGWQIGTGVAAAISIAANAVAIYLASLAAVGSPRLKDIKEMPSLIDVDEGPTAQAKGAVDRLRLALAAAAVSLVAGMVAVAFVWYGSGVPGTSATLTLTTGQSVCGSIATTDLTKNSGEIMFTSNGTTKPYPVNQIAQINVGTC